MLKKLKLTPFTATELKPSGWLRQQLIIQAQGLSGNLDKIWPDIRDSRWIGGDKEGWERVPYWLDGFIPLAWLLDDADMKQRAKKYIDAILSRQKEDGWLCPCEDEERPKYDMWALFLICKVLVVYYECTGDERIEEAIAKALKNLNRHIEKHTLFDWSATRWYECLIPLFWLYERRPENWMKELAIKLYAQGTDHSKLFDHWHFQQPYEHGRWSQMTHVVNLAMCLKAQALISRLIGGESNEYAKRAIRLLLRDHGMAVEHFTGDECLSGTSPIQGTELCSVVEAMYSFEQLLSITADPEWSDRLENAAYNALPATISPDMWTHQYDQMTNQVQCSRLSDGSVPFRTNSGESHLFGLEPNYGCCTANFNQGWPKFALSTFMRAEDGIAQTAIAPAVMDTEVGGVKVRIACITNYPFEDGYILKVVAEKPVEFTLHVRITSCADSAAVDGQSAQSGFTPVRRVWGAEEQTIEVAFGFEPKLVPRPSGMYCVRRGPLLYSVAIEEKWEKLEYVRNGVERKFPYCDYEIYPQSKWNYGFANDRFEVHKGTVGKIPFNPKNPPIWFTAQMVELDWPMINGVCSVTPSSLTPLCDPQPVKMIPYGCTNLRMTEMPYIKA